MSVHLFESLITHFEKPRAQKKQLVPDENPRPVVVRVIVAQLGVFGNNIIGIVWVLKSLLIGPEVVIAIIIDWQPPTNYTAINLKYLTY